jgi:uncharacterized membrane protein
MDHLTNFFGRFHPLLVHLPIGAIILAFLFDALSLSRKYRRLSLAVHPALLFGTLSALLSAVTGLCLSEEGGYENETLSYHKYSGIFTTVFAFALLFLRRNNGVLYYERRVRKPVRFFLFLPLLAALITAGHFGGSLTHGDEFITGFSFLPLEEKIDPLTKIQFITQPDEAVLYQDVIQPILESKCYSCHSSAKQKGDLRLDDQDHILRGGKDGKIIAAGVADSSSLFARIMLPSEHDDHMPPNEKPQPSSIEVDLIRLWINEGARFDKKIKDLHESQKAVEFVTLLADGIKKENWIPREEVSPASEGVLQKLKASGIIVLPVGANSNYLHANFTNVRSLTKESVQVLNPLSDQVVSLRFSYCNFEENDLKFLDNFSNLIWLYLDHTNVSDTSFQSVKSLPNLKYLNVVFTGVSERSIDSTKFPKLEQIFVFQTNIEGEDVMKLQQKNPTLKIDTGGVALPKIASDTIIYRKKT